MKLKLSDISQIRGGYTFRSLPRGAMTSPYRVLHIRNVSDDGFVRINEATLMDLPTVDERYFVRRDDILFASRGARNVAATCPDWGERLVVGSQFLMITPDTQRILPQYLAWYMNSKTAQSYFAENASGSYVQMIKASDIANLQIPLPPLDLQRRVVELVELAGQEVELLEKLAIQRRMLISQAAMVIAMGAEEKNR